MNTAILYKGKLQKTVSHKEEIFDFILYDRALGNNVTNSESFISYEL